MLDVRDERGSVRVTRNQGTYAELGVDRAQNGFVLTRNQSGQEMSALSVASNGSGGRVSVSKAGGDVTVLMGVLTNGKGDVCANGAPGKQVCLSGLAVKTFTPY